MAKVRWDYGEPSRDVKTQLTTWTDDWRVSIESTDYDGDYFRLHVSNLRRMTAADVKAAAERMILALQAVEDDQDAK